MGCTVTSLAHTATGPYLLGCRQYIFGKYFPTFFSLLRSTRWTISRFLFFLFFFFFHFRRSNNMLSVQQRVRSKVWRSVQSVQPWNGKLQFSTTIGAHRSSRAHDLSENQPEKYNDEFSTFFYFYL